MSDTSKFNIKKAFGHLAHDQPAGPQPITYVLHIDFAGDPPRVAVCETFDEAEGHLDAFEVSVFDPPQDDVPDRALLRARIFECKGADWATEVDIGAAREKRWRMRDVGSG